MESRKLTDRSSVEDQPRRSKSRNGPEILRKAVRFDNKLPAPRVEGNRQRRDPLNKTLVPFQTSARACEGPDLWPNLRRPSGDASKLGENLCDYKQKRQRKTFIASARGRRLASGPENRRREGPTLVGEKTQAKTLRVSGKSRYSYAGALGGCERGLGGGQVSTSYLIPFENVVSNTVARRLHARGVYGLCTDRERSLKIVYSSRRTPSPAFGSVSAPSALLSPA